MPGPRPSARLLSSLSDEHVVLRLVRHGRATRAELADATGLSKPTVGGSVERLVEAGLVVDTGERTTGGRGRGRVGTYFDLAPDLGCALAVTVGHDGVVAECVDVRGTTVGRGAAAVDLPPRPRQVGAAVRAAARAARRGTVGPLRLAVVSAANPVERATGRLVRLAGNPFLLAELDPARILGSLVAGPVVVDNDVNWAARAERDAGAGDDFAFLYLGQGMGAAVVCDGEVRRGHSGLAGEVAHVLTADGRGRAVRLVEVVERLGLTGSGTTAVDLDRLRATLDRTDGAALRLLGDLGRAVAGVVAALVAVADPAEVVLGGPWGGREDVVASVVAALESTSRPVRVRAARVRVPAELAAVRADARTRLEADLVERAAGPG